MSSSPAERRLALAHAPGLTLGNAGNVVSSFPTGLEFGLGLVYDTSVDRLWIANPYYPDFGINGDGLEHQFLPDGTDTGETIDIHDTGGFQQADGTYNGRTGMLWQVNLGGDNCLFEMDPITKVVTGNKICGPWDSPRRALAYDYATDTYYVAGTNDDLLYHLDSAGNLLETVSTGLGIAGLAYNPTTRHLFAVTPGGGPWDVWVLDPQAGYTVLGGFRVTESGVPVLGFDAIGLEADCAGRLWLNTTDSDIVYSFESGETGWCVNDIPWLSENPTEGTISSSALAPCHRLVRLARTASRAPPGAHSSSRPTHRHWSRRCRSTSRSSSTTCRRAASPGTSSMARREPASCRAARRRLRRSPSAPPKSSRGGAWRGSSSGQCTER